MTPGRRGTVIVGIDTAGTVTCAREDEAYEYARVERAIDEAKTWGDFWRAMPADSGQEVRERMREHAEAFDEPMPEDTAPFDAMRLPGYGDGDWPVHPAFNMLCWVPGNVRALGEVVSTVFHGELLEIDGSRIDDVIAALEAVGYRVLRSDAAMQG